MATTTPEAPASTTQDGHPPAPLHLCYDALDDDRLYDDVIDPEPASELFAPNLRSHAEVPAPDGFELPSKNCVVYRGSAPVNVRTWPGDEPFIEAVVVSATTLSELQFEALAVARRLQDATIPVTKRTWAVTGSGVIVTRSQAEVGAKFCGFSAVRSRGMGRELDVWIVRANPEVRGFWHRDVAEEALVAALKKLPAPARVPVEGRAVQVTERPGPFRPGRWTRIACMHDQHVSCALCALRGAA